MRKQFISGVLSLAFVAAPLAVTGCDREVSHTKEVKTDPDTGKTKVDEKKVEKTADGGTKTVEEHKTTNP